MIGWLAAAAVVALAVGGHSSRPHVAETRDWWQLELRRRKRKRMKQAHEQEIARQVASRRALVRAKAKAVSEARERREAERRDRRLNTVRDAIVWVKHLAPQVETYVAAHWADLLKDKPGIVRRFFDQSSPIASADRCIESAIWFLNEFPEEACFLLAEGERNSASVATMLRTYHGREIELMLPKAMAIECQRLIAPQDPALAGEINDPLALFPAEDREALRASLRDLRTLRELEDLLDSDYAGYEERLRQREPALEEHEVAHALQKYRANQDKLKEDWAASKELVA